MTQTRNSISRLTVEGQRVFGDICRRYGVGEETGLALLDALAQTNGSMAQFNLPELGGSGQWMSGGMTMVGDMFNHGLKSRVDGLCTELGSMLLTAPFIPATSLSDGNLFINAQCSIGKWWPASLGMPNWQGSQNNFRYAYFATTCRLALNDSGDVSVYDTGGFVLTGVSQQQSSGYGASLTFTGPGGIVTLDRLRRVDSELSDAPPVMKPETQESKAQATVVRGKGNPAPTPDVVHASDPCDVLDERLAGSKWLYAPKTGAIAIPVVLGADGVLIGTDINFAKYWAAEEALLWFYGADGKATARFDRITHEPDGTQMVGTSPPVTGAPIVLRAYSPPNASSQNSPATIGSAILELRLDLCAHRWAFGVKGDDVIATLSLDQDGVISGGKRQSESLWRIEDGRLVFLHKSGRPTVRFTSIDIHDSQWTLWGKCIANDQIVHELRQIPSVPDVIR